MHVHKRYVLQQGDTLLTIARAGLSMLNPPDGKGPLPAVPSEKIEKKLAPRSKQLIADNIRWFGGDARAYRGTLPPWFFPQWGLAMMGGALEDIPFPIASVLNQGTAVTVNRPLPADKPLIAKAWLHDIEEQETKWRIHQRMTTGTADDEEMLIADIFAVVKKKGGGKGGKRRGPPVVPAHAQEIGFKKLGPKAGFEYALLGGDFNPIHWIGPYAKAAGFRSTPLHGFATLGLAMEAVIKSRLAGNPHRLAGVDVRFTKPVLLPAKLRFFVDRREDGSTGFAAGTAPGGPAYMLGTYTTRED
ncbi:MAG: hypothetical protein EP330_16035 [Deltaproteobacteria bacterium]|nr:MAG: hypothetical protein EP330_16035 [Deltaproteobacteria bacterium]